jgi:single-strand DNA-binding protein
MSVNKAILIGNCGSDPETKEFDRGSLTVLSLATNETYLKDGHKVTDTEWHRLVFYGKLSDVARKYLKKGDMIYVEGKIRTRSWEKDGIKRYSTEITVNSINMLGGKSRDSDNVTQESEGNGHDDLAF